MALFKSTERCNSCCGTGWKDDYYDYDKNNQPKRKPCSECKGQGWVEKEE